MVKFSQWVLALIAPDVMGFKVRCYTDYAILEPVGKIDPEYESEYDFILHKFDREITDFLRGVEGYPAYFDLDLLIDPLWSNQ